MCSASVEHKGGTKPQQETNPSICHLPSSRCADEPSSPPATARSYVGDWAREQIRQLDEFALIGYPILTLEQRAAYEVSLRLGAERLLDEVGK